MDAQPQRKPASLASSHHLGLASLLFASVARVAASIPYLRLIALPMSGLGILLAIIAINSNRRGRKPGIGLPLTGGALSFAVFLLAGFWLNQFDIILGSLRKSPVTEQKTVPLRSQANRSETNPQV